MRNTMNKILAKNGFSKVSEFTVLPQVHEIEHFLQYNRLYEEAASQHDEEFTIPSDVRPFLERYINKNKLGYKLITIGQRV